MRGSILITTTAMHVNEHASHPLTSAVRALNLYGKKARSFLPRPLSSNYAYARHTPGTLSSQFLSFLPKKIQTYHAGIQTAGSTLRATTVFVGDHLTTSAIGCGTLLRTQGRWRFEPIARTFRTPQPYSCFKNATSFWRHAYPCTVLLHFVKFPRRQNHLMR